MRCLPWTLLCFGVCVGRTALAEPAPSESPPAPEPVSTPTAPPAPIAPTVAPAPAPDAPATASPAAAPLQEDRVPALPAPWTVQFGGYVQPQFRVRQDSDAQFDEDGFRFARARLIAQARTRAGNLDLSAFIEAEMQPTFDLVDAFVSVAGKLPGKGTVALDLGQMRVPISRQQLLSDSRLAFVDKGQVATIAPRRDLGARVGLVVPSLPQVRILGGVFNGEGPNQVQNINQKFLYASRLELTPIGHEDQLAESAFGGSFLTAAVSVGLDQLTAGTRGEDVRYLGADLSGSWKGLSGSVEYLVADHSFDAGGATTMQDYRANGWVAQLNYLLPVELPPDHQSRFELGARVEEIDRNDTVPIAQLGDPEQSVRIITGVVSLYLRKHSIKAQLAFNHFQEIETKTSVGENAVYDNDQLLLQVTYRME